MKRLVQSRTIIHFHAAVAYFFLLSTLFFSIACACCTPHVIDCDAVLDEPKHFVLSGQPHDISVADAAALRDCGQLDSMDIEILRTTMLSMLVYDNMLAGQPTTLRSMIATMQEFKQTEDYEGIRDAMAFSFHFSWQHFSESSWPAAKPFFEGVGMSPQQIDSFKTYLQLPENSRRSYHEALADFLEHGAR